MRSLLSVLIFLTLAATARAEMYKAMMVRAAPGELLNFIELYKQRLPLYEKSGDRPPFWMRHSQGDHWDILFLFPMGSFGEYYSPERIGRREAALKAAGFDQKEFARKFYRMAAWHEEVYVDGPPLGEVEKAFGGAAFFHVEMFLSLPGKQDQLRRQREMENIYLKDLGRPLNLIFTHRQGAAWDLFTIGFYRDLKHFAESADIPADREDQAAKKAGFESASHIGPYLRTLISSHHDTLAVAIR